MKHRLPWQFTLVPLFLLASAALYCVHYFIFRDVHHIFLYLLGDLAFLFIDVLVVILIIENLLERREKKSMMKKMNMVIGIFFSEVGLELLRKFTVFVQNTESLKAETDMAPHWDKKDFERARRAAHAFSYRIQARPEMLIELRAFLLSKYPFLLGLLENPNLLEHERFTDLLWAVFHLAEELSYRNEKLEGLPESDIHHLAGDLLRAYSQIVDEWISYAQHLKMNYPFLFSLAVRINPLGSQTSATVQPSPKDS
jgi:hypothetical protein